jgi:hypothetical protein
MPLLTSGNLSERLSAAMRASEKRTGRVFESRSTSGGTQDNGSIMYSSSLTWNGGRACGDGARNPIASTNLNNVYRFALQFRDDEYFISLRADPRTLSPKQYPGRKPISSNGQATAGFLESMGQHSVFTARDVALNGHQPCRRM